MTSIEALAAYVATGVRGSITQPLRDKLRLHVIDTANAWITTAASREARALAALCDNLRKTAGDDAALQIMINCATVRMSEVDDIHLGAMITPGAIVIPGALSIAASLPETDADALNEAILAGYEAMIRLGVAIDGPAILYRGIWPTYFAAPFGIAAVAARLLNLTETQTAHALALSLTLAAPGVGHHNAPTGSRWLAAGASARNGLLAARAAQASFTADVAVLDGPFFPGVLGITPNVAALAGGLGGTPKLLEVSFKPWCAARQTMTATQALREVIASGVTSTDIKRVQVGIPPQFQRMVDHGIADGDRVSRLTSLPYQLAIAAVAPDEAFHTGQTRAIPQAVHDFMRRIEIAPDTAMGDGYPRVWGARIEVDSEHSSHKLTVAHIPGDPERPFDLHQLCEKFGRFAGRKIGEQAMDALIADCTAVLDGGTSPAQLLAAIERARTTVAGG